MATKTNVWGAASVDWALLAWRVYWVSAFLLLAWTVLAGVVWEFEVPPGFVITLITFLYWLVGGILWKIWAASRRRARDLVRVARELELAYTPKVSEEALGRLSHFALFNRGQEPLGRHGMEGERKGVPLRLLDYRYVFIVGVGDDAYGIPYDQTVVVFPEPAAGLPDFALVPKGMFNKTADQLVGTAVGLVIGKLGDVDVDGGKDPAFRKSYRVDGSDEAALRKVFDAKARAFFVENADWCIECRGGQLLIYKAGVLTNPSKYAARIDKAFEIRRALLKKNVGV
jgi:hypothetical protein